MKVIESIRVLPVHRWLLIDSLISAVIGIALFTWPSLCMPQLLINGGDGVSWHLGRCIGAQILCVSCLFYKISQSRDENTYSTCLLCRMLICAFTLAVSFHAKAYYLKHVYLVSLRFMMIFSGLYLAFCIWQLLRIKWPVGNVLQVQNPVPRSLILLDSFGALIVGAMWIAFPEWILHRQVTGLLDGSHLLTARLMGCMFIATHVISTQAIYWKNSFDRNIWAFGRCIMCAGLLSAQVYSQVAYGPWWRGTHWVGISFCSLWGSLVGFYCYMTYKGYYK